MNIFKFAIGLMSALAFSQFPAFETHYETRLQARVDELGRQMALFEQAAKTCRLSLAQYIEFFDKQPQKESQEMAKVIGQTLKRKNKLEHLYLRLSQSSYPKKLWILVKEIDQELTVDTYRHHQLLLIFDEASALFALFGAFIGATLYHLAMKAIKKGLQAIPASLKSISNAKAS